MTARVAPPPRVTAVSRPSMPGRVFGFGSVFGKTLRDARWSIVVVSAVLCVLIVAGGGTMAGTYGTSATRAELALMARTLPPALVGIYGDPVNVDTFGGFISWHYGAYFALLTGLWSIIALSGTIAGEASRGSLDLAAVTPRSRRVLAGEKLAGHVVAVAAMVTIVGVVTWVAATAFGRFDRDAVAPGAVFAFAVSIALKGLVAGSIAFAVAPLIGRGAAAGLAGGVMLAAYLANSYRAVVPALDGPASLGWFAWTRGALPLAGREDWASIGLVAAVAAGLCAIGIEMFARRDIGVTLAVRTPRLPAMFLGIRGPLGRSFGELLPRAVSWGVGLSTYGFVMAISSNGFIEQLRRSPGVLEALGAMVPGIDLATTPGFLQFVFIDMGLLLVGLAAATLVAGWASDESSGRLELLLTMPLSRFRWVVASATGVALSIAVTVGMVAIAMAAGVAFAGADPVTPAVGLIAVALYGAAMAGIGIALGGVVRPSLAAAASVAVVVGTFFVQMLAPALRLPEWVQDLALSDHMGKPLVGSWDPVGLVLCLVLAVGGTLIGAAGMTRRDVG